MALERIRSWIQAWTWTEEEVSWTLVLQIILLTIALGFFLMLFGAVLMTYSTRKYEAMTKFWEASRPIDRIRTEISADMFEALTKDRDLVDGLFNGDFVEGLYHGDEVIADMYEKYEEPGKERDFVRKLFHGDEDGVKSD